MEQLQSTDLAFDPRPLHLRQMSSYPSTFRNAVLTYTGPGSDMPVKQLYEPANMYALVNDHDYTRDPEQSMLQQLQVYINILASKPYDSTCRNCL